MAAVAADEEEVEGVVSVGRSTVVVAIAVVVVVAVAVVDAAFESFPFLTETRIMR